MSLRKKISLFAITVPLFYIAAVLFGAPFLSTLSLATVLPIIWSCEPDNESICEFVLEGRVDTLRQLIAKHICVGSVLGALCGAVVIPLDWDRWWQKWPIPCLISTLAGAFLGLLWAQAQIYLNSKTNKKQFSNNKHMKTV